MSSNSRKRKLGDEKKFYAVKAGKIPGVYTTWDDCRENITGFKGASFKSFPSHQEAQDYVNGKIMPSKPTGDRFYGVAVGKVPGVYTEWSQAQIQITDVKGPKYKKFGTRAEAEEFVRSGGQISTVAKGPKETKEKKSRKEVPDEIEAVWQEDIRNGSLGNEEEGVEREEEFQVEEKVVKKARTSASSGGKKKTTVYTDGSSLGNGQKGSMAGVGVWFGDGDSRNVSEPLEGQPQTNNRAELTGVLRALQLAPKDRDLEIITDSNYSINCVTIWYQSWMKKNWKTSSNKDVENQDLIKDIRKLIVEREELELKTVFTWIKGHANDPGNEAADKLAVAGAHEARARAAAVR